MMRLGFVLLFIASALQAQWQVQVSNTTADLRGIHSLGHGVAWASGSKGTVLRTVDNGSSWQACAVPAGAEALDFRGVQAFDAQTAIVMSSGKGDLSRLYKTEDGCKTWKLVFTNPDPDGFWDGLSFPEPATSPFANMGYLIGDPVGGAFALFETEDAGRNWHRWRDASQKVTHCARSEAPAAKGEALFAASNTSMLVFFSYNFLFVTGGSTGSRLVYADSRSQHGDDDGPCKTSFGDVSLPLARGSSASGAFGFAAQSRSSYFPFRLMVVGGDYTKPDDTTGNAVFIRSNGVRHGKSIFEIVSPTTPPRGYRSSVAYLSDAKAWITVGPNGTDLSLDDGRNWRALRPGTAGEADGDQHWNALSLPFVVGPHGRIGLLRENALGR